MCSQLKYVSSTRLSYEPHISRCTPEKPRKSYTTQLTLIWSSTAHHSMQQQQNQQKQGSWTWHDCSYSLLPLKIIHTNIVLVLKWVNRSIQCLFLNKTFLFLLDWQIMDESPQKKKAAKYSLSCLIGGFSSKMTLGMPSFAKVVNWQHKNHWKCEQIQWSLCA